jgi:protein-disulfide isomerase
MSNRTPSGNPAASLTPVDHVLGAPDARVIVVEYGDFECPVCAQAYGGVKIMLKHFGRRIRFAFRHFPIVASHPHAEIAAEASEVAGAQGKFWQMHDRLFENQQHLKPNALRQYAQAIELDLQRFDSELGDHLYLQRVQEHLASGRACGVRSTPSFFVDGSLVDVSFGMERLSAAIETRLGKTR